MKFTPKKLVSLLGIFTMAIIVVGGLYYSNTYKCVELREGTVSAKVKYSEEFFFRDPIGYNISIYADKDAEKKKQGHAFQVISVGSFSSFYDTVDSIIEASRVEPGPKFTKKVEFNGREAALAEIRDSEFGDADYYKVPIGDRVLLIDFRTNGLLPEEKEKAQEILNSIILTETKEDLKEPQVRNCLY